MFLGIIRQIHIYGIGYKYSYELVFNLGQTNVKQDRFQVSYVEYIFMAFDTKHSYELVFNLGQTNVKQGLIEGSNQKVDQNSDEIKRYRFIQ